MAPMSHRPQKYDQIKNILKNSISRSIQGLQNNPQQDRHSSMLEQTNSRRFLKIHQYFPANIHGGE
jgi:hypothetical protein